MFGISFGEALLLALIMIVVVGPRDLPRMMRSLGQNISKLRRTANHLRTQSGIDEILQGEGIHQELQDLRKLATGRIMEIGLHEPLLSPSHRPSSHSEEESDDGADESDPYRIRRTPPQQREYPLEGPDSYGSLAEEPSATIPGEPPQTPLHPQTPAETIARGSLDADDTDAAQ